MRKVALAGGIAYLVTFAASFPQLQLFASLVADPVGFLKTGDTTPVLGASGWRSSPPPPASAPQ